MPSLTDRFRIAGRAATVAGKAVVGIFNDDSARVAWGLLTGVQPGGMGVPPTRGTAEYLRAYSQSPWLRAVTGRIADRVARTEWQLFVVRKAGKGQRAVYDDRVKAIQRARDPRVRRKLLRDAQSQQELQPVLDHPMIDVLHNANEFQTGYNMRKVTQLHVDLVGDAFWLKERDAKGMIIGLWPVPPNWIMATPTPVFRYFRVAYRGWRGNIPDTEWVWFNEVDPLNPYGRGSGAAMALGDELDADEYAARMVKAFFYNQGRPDVLVYPKGGGNLDKGNIARVEEEWSSKVSGFWRAFKPLFLTREVEVKTFDQNLRSQQFVQIREMERNVVMQMYGIPPEILGVLTNSNRSTIDAADYMMNRNVVEPRLEFQRSVMQERVVPEFDERLILDYVSPTQEDREDQMDAAKAAPWSLSNDEWRKLQGLGPHEDEDFGAMHAVPFNVTMERVEDVVEPPEPPSPPPVPPGGQPPPPPTGQLPPPQPGTAPDAGGTPDPAKPAAAPKVPPKALPAGHVALYAEIAAADDANDAPLAAALRKALAESDTLLPPPSRVAAQLEPGLRRAVLRAWRDHQARVDVAALERDVAAPHGTTGDLVDRLDLPGLAGAVDAAARPLILRAVLRGAAVGAQPLAARGVAVRMPGESAAKRGPQVDFAAVNHFATEWARDHAAQLVVAAPEVRAAIAALVARANEEGIAPYQLARLIRASIGLLPRQVEAVSAFERRLAAEGVAGDALARRVGRYADAQLRSRANTIARTETLSAVNNGQLALWRSARDQGMLRDADLRKQWLVTDDDALCTEVCEPLGEDDPVGIDEPFASGDMAPPGHPNCRCSVGLVSVQDIQAAGIVSSGRRAGHGVRVRRAGAGDPH